MLLIIYNHHYNETHILYLVYLCSCLGLGLFLSYPYKLFLIFSLNFNVIGYITSFKQTYLFFAHFFEYLRLFLDDNMDEASDEIQSQGVA